MTLQKDVADRTVELGGTHKYDLTPDVTHLIVGDYNTPKYRHVARERPDIKAMDVGWIESLTDLWKNDDHISFRKLEAQYQLKPLERCGAGSIEGGDKAAGTGLVICLTGFGAEWKDIAEKIQINGGNHRADLTRTCTHLIAKKPEGKKFNAARNWRVNTVTLDWLEQSLERGLILDESKFDPLLPIEEQGVDAWTKKDAAELNNKKRGRSTNSGQDDGARKLRKTASIKLNSQHNTLWGDILGPSTSRAASFRQDSIASEATAPKPALPAAPAEPAGVFSKCVFYAHSFTSGQSEILQQTIVGLGGTIAPSLVAARTMLADDPVTQRFLVVRQLSPPETHPTTDEGVHVVTEFYIERCLHAKKFFNPNDSALGRPFPLFPIPGFDKLQISIAAFRDLELNQISRAVKQLGATMEENFQATASVLVCKSIANTRKEKLTYARRWHVPVVTQDWLWQCIATGYQAPFDKFIIPGYEVTQHDTPTYGGNSLTIPTAPLATTANKAPKSRPPPAAGLDATAFDRDSPAPTKPKSSAKVKVENLSTADFLTAKSISTDTSGAEQDSALSERSSSSLNKSPASAKMLSDAESKAGSENERPRSAVSKSNAASSEDEVSREKIARKAADVEREQITSEITNFLNAVPTPGTELGADAQTIRPRRRQILGRATSNASSAGAVPVNDSLLQRTLSSVGATEDDDEDRREPPATQLEYRDPQAQEARTALMTKLLAQEAPAAAGTRSGRNKK